MLGVPFIPPSVSKIEIGESLTVEQEMEDGLYTCTVPVPCVLSVSEKINRARAIKPDTPQMYERIRSVDAAWLGIDVNGARDSPTVVVGGTQKVESQRNVQFIEPDGHLYEKVMEIIERSRAREEVRTVSLSNIKGGEKEAWAIALDDARVSMEVASKVAEIASASGLRVRVIGNVDFRGGEAPPAHRLEVLEGGDSVAIANYISSRIRELRPEFVLFPPSTTRGA
ncbi:hypothetical protein [Thermogymnomonas acidicola]|uniref:hypothetical protein n=1 Tax=Thermogymnomonas acidicola TaxID=399579 RepID=UPI0009462B63|nr:hypothetical protein [Thermogymnomonas acidicola]